MVEDWQTDCCSSLATATPATALPLPFASTSVVASFCCCCWHRRGRHLVAVSLLPFSAPCHSSALLNARLIIQIVEHTYNTKQREKSIEIGGGEGCRRERERDKIKNRRQRRRKEKETIRTASVACFVCNGSHSRWREMNTKKRKIKSEKTFEIAATTKVVAALAGGEMRSQTEAPSLPLLLLLLLLLLLS